MADLWLLDVYGISVTRFMSLLIDLRGPSHSLSGYLAVQLIVGTDQLMSRSRD
jgi:hypothetical protein